MRKQWRPSADQGISAPAVHFDLEDEYVVSCHCIRIHNYLCECDLVKSEYLEWMHCY